jgi:hypothetical protein
MRTPPSSFVTVEIRGAARIFGPWAVSCDKRFMKIIS